MKCVPSAAYSYCGQHQKPLPYSPEKSYMSGAYATTYFATEDALAFPSKEDSPQIAPSTAADDRGAGSLRIGEQ